MNQPPALEDYDAYTWNQALQEAVRRAGADVAAARLHALGAIAGSGEGRYHAARSDAHPPVLHRYDGIGARVDGIECDPSWDWLVDRTIEHDLHGLPFREDIAVPHAARAALILVWGELDLPTICPISGNFAMVQALGADPALKAMWAERLLTQDRSRLLFGAAAMTERQGGSDVRDTRSIAVEQQDGTYLLSGQKWFVTCPWADLVLILAMATAGLTCFLAESSHAGFRIERLKHKLGWHGLGVGEVELHELPARRLGEEGRGVAAIMRMIAFTRLDVLLENVASMRLGVLRAVHHARHRCVLGRPLATHPLMRNVLADLALEAEAATAGAMRVAASYDSGETAFGRLALPILKYWVAKRAAPHAAEAMECLGGDGFVEASGMPRLLRNSVVGSIWEGSGNVAALDVLRAVRRDGAAFDAFAAECRLAAGADTRLDGYMSATLDAVPGWAASDDAEYAARAIVERLALTLQASLLVRHAPDAVADAFCAGRLGDRTLPFGGLPGAVDVDATLARVIPA